MNYIVHWQTNPSPARPYYSGKLAVSAATPQEAEAKAVRELDWQVGFKPVALIVKATPVTGKNGKGTRTKVT